MIETIPGLLPRLRPEYDDLPGYWEHGLSIWADHCGVCGKWASVVAFSTQQHWKVTDCKKCGMVRVDMFWVPGSIWKTREVRVLEGKR